MQILCVWGGQRQAPCHHFTVWKKGHACGLWVSSSGPQSSLDPEIQGIWCSSTQPQALQPKDSCFLILLHYSAVLLKSLNAETPISLVRTLWQFSEHRPSPFYFAALHFEFKACCQPGKHQSSDLAAPWLCSTEGLIFHNLLKSSPNSYQKFPWWEMLLWEGVAALWLTLFH